METQNPSLPKKESSYLSVIGSSISAICFFAPWIGCSGKTMSGSDLGDGFWLVFLLSVISIIAFFFFKSEKTLSKARSIITISSLIGLGYLFYKYIRFQSNEFHYVFEIKWGSIATLLGFVISLIGVAYLNDAESKTRFAGDIFCTNCGKKYSSEMNDKFCEECGNKL